jgi:hypothetical protein
LSFEAVHRFGAQVNDGGVLKSLGKTTLTTGRPCTVIAEPNGEAEPDAVLVIVGAEDVQAAAVTMRTKPKPRRMTRLWHDQRGSRPTTEDARRATNPFRRVFGSAAMSRKAWTGLKRRPQEPTTLSQASK